MTEIKVFPDNLKDFLFLFFLLFYIHFLNLFSEILSSILQILQVSAEKEFSAETADPSTQPGFCRRRQ